MYSILYTTKAYPLAVVWQASNVVYWVLWNKKEWVKYKIILFKFNWPSKNHERETHAWCDSPNVCDIIVNDVH